MEQPKNYNAIFANMYDGLMSEEKYARWKNIIQKGVEKYAIPRNFALDVACGTGAISEMLFELDFENVDGLDLSQDMLNVAKEKFQKYGTRFNTINANMTCIPSTIKYDLVVSFYDSINYLLSLSDMDKFLKGVETSLKPGGYAIFDMNTKEHVAISQRTPSKKFPIEGGDILFKYGGEGEIWELLIEITRNGETIRETHLERGYSSKEITKLIQNKNLELIDIISDNKVYWDNKEHLSRQYYILKKTL